MIYGYARVSTMRQDVDIQEDAILEKYPNAHVYKEEKSGKGKCSDRPVWTDLEKKLKKGDTVIFTEVSRMSRNAEEGFRVYKALFEKGVNLVFLKESLLNTDLFRKTAQLEPVGNWIADEYIAATNRVLMRIAELQIKEAFVRAEEELRLKEARQKEGYAKQKKRNERLAIDYPDTYKEMDEYHQIGREKGDVLNVKKEKPIKALIKKLSKEFDGTNTDKEVLSILADKKITIEYKKNSGEKGERIVSAKIDRKTYYKYKKELKGEQK